MNDEAQTHVHKFKHLGCGLHFIVLSWEPEWKPKVCPECGEGGKFLHWAETSEDFIFEYVPGRTPLAVNLG